MTYRPALALVLPLALGLLPLPASAQGSPNGLPLQAQRPSVTRPDHAFHVDATGAGDFDDLPAAIAAAPNGSLLVVAPGAYSGATVAGRSLRIEATLPGTARLTGELVITGVLAQDEVHVGGLFFEEGFRVEGCAGEVGFSSCTAIDDGVVVPPPPGVNFFQYPDCGVG